MISIATALALISLSSGAYALGFGRMHVKSALGQPLDAEVELTDAQAAGLKAGMASAQMYQDKGVEYNSIVKNIYVSVRPAAGGRVVLHLTSDRPINDPFVDVVLQASDGTSNVVRDFSILLDPPVRTRTPPVVASPIVSSNVVAQSTQAVIPAQEAVSNKLPAQQAEENPKRQSQPQPKGVVNVSRGETAGQIAMANRPAHVSLDQMLLAILKANSHAFINGNVNLLKSGVVLKMPTAQQAQAVSAAQARTVILAQSEDFRSYRHGLAKSSTMQAAPSAQQSTGKVQTQVLDSKTSPVTAPDQLTVSGAGVAGKSNTKETRIAKALENKNKADRAEELNKNLTDLKNISAEVAASSQKSGTTGKSSNEPAVITMPLPGAQPNTGSPSTVVPASAGDLTKPVQANGSNDASSSAQVDVTASQPAEVASQAASDAASQMEPAASAVDAASQPASMPVNQASAIKKPLAVQAPEPVPEPSIFDALMDNSTLIGAGLVGVSALLFVLYRRKKQQAAANSTSFGEDSLEPDSFFNVSGGKDVDTSESHANFHSTDIKAAHSQDMDAAPDLGQSSMLYSPSQLDAKADVDPVSEAEVYLAYGRDVQAEEILKDALTKYPDGISIYAKLLEIYAKRQDIKAYAQLSATLKKLTKATGPDWATACAMGNEIDPGNPLYGDCQSQAKSAEPKTGNSQLMGQRVSLPSPQERVAKSLEQGNSDSLQTNLDSLFPMTQPLPSETVMPAASPVNNLAALDLSLDLSDVGQPNITAPANNTVINFDMTGISLDLDKPMTQKASQESDAFATKLALAREFLNVGDKDGARSMAEEIAKNATGQVQEQAQALLQSIH